MGKGHLHLLRPFTALPMAEQQEVEVATSQPGGLPAELFGEVKNWNRREENNLSPSLKKKVSVHVHLLKHAFQCMRALHLLIKILRPSLAKERNKAQITSEDANIVVTLLLDIILTSPDVATRVIAHSNQSLSLEVNARLELRIEMAYDMYAN